MAQRRRMASISATGHAPRRVREGSLDDHPDARLERRRQRQVQGLLVGHVDRGLQRVEAPALHRVAGGRSIAAVADEAGLPALARPLDHLDHLAAAQIVFRAGVKLEQIDVVGAQAREAPRDAPLERGDAPVVAPGALEVTTLGEQMDVRPSTGDRLTDEGLGVAVALRGVDDVEAGVERIVQQPTHGARLGTLEADLRAAEAEHAHPQPRPAEPRAAPWRSARSARDEAHAARRSSCTGSGMRTAWVGRITTSQPAGT